MLGGEVISAKKHPLLFFILKKNLHKRQNLTIFAVAKKNRGVAQLVSALRSGRRGRAFESPHPDRKPEKPKGSPASFLFSSESNS